MRFLIFFSLVTCLLACDSPTHGELRSLVEDEYLAEGTLAGEPVKEIFDVVLSSEGQEGAVYHFGALVSGLLDSKDKLRFEEHVNLEVVRKDDKWEIAERSFNK